MDDTIRTEIRNFLNPYLFTVSAISQLDSFNVLKDKTSSLFIQELT